MNKLYSVRRWILSKIIPEFIWPQYAEIDHIKFKLRGTPYSYGIKKLLSANPDGYEYPERVFCRLIERGDKVLEFGGSIGVLTRIIADRVGPNGSILSVEASRELATYSKSWLENLGNTKVISAFAFPIMHSLPVKATFNNTLGSLGGRVIIEKENAKEDEHQSFFIENAEKDYGLQPNVLVCDIEGSEMIMLKYKPDFPDYLKTIIIELHSSMYGVETMMQIVECIKREGFILNSSIQSVYLFQRQ